jgi:hypothetical protein
MQYAAACDTRPSLIHSHAESAKVDVVRAPSQSNVLGAEAFGSQVCQIAVLFPPDLLVAAWSDAARSNKINQWIAAQLTDDGVRGATTQMLGHGDKPVC